jgi:hypothetical protein
MMNDYLDVQLAQLPSTSTTDDTAIETIQLNNTIVLNLPETSQAKLEVIQTLIEPCDRCQLFFAEMKKL